jgi:hypothetical protein
MLATAAKEGRRMASLIALAGASIILLAGYLTGPQQDWQWRVGITAIGVGGALLTAWFGVLNREDRNEIGRLRHAN